MGSGTNRARYLVIYMRLRACYDFDDVCLEVVYPASSEALQRLRARLTEHLPYNASQA
jgi:hypothetical protein